MCIKGQHTPQETRSKQSESNKGKKRSPETRAKLSIVAKNRVFSYETRAKMSAAKIGNTCALGRTHTQETKAKISDIMTGRVVSPETRYKQSLAMRGRQFSDEHKAKLSAYAKKRTYSQETRTKISIAHRGKTFSYEHKLKISSALSREKNPQWQGGISFEPYCPKFNADLRRRIRAFFGYECTTCGKSTEENKKNLGCHHVEYNKQACCDGKPVQFAALCLKCHGKTNHEQERWEAMLHRIIDEIYDGRSYYTKEEWKEMNK